MPLSIRFAVVSHCRLFAGLIALWSTSLFAAEGNDRAGLGVIEGRVTNSRSTEYLEKARLTIEGTTLEAFTNPDGWFRLAGVPSGPAKVRVFFTGLEPVTETVAVVAGQAVRHDFLMTAADARDGGVVKLSQFVVGASREIDGTAIAINEQRFAPNITNVVSTDEFGAVPEGNIGEFIKFMPSITVEASGGNARWISINGVPPDNVPVMIDGFSLAGTGNAGTGRAADVDMMSINNAARIEVSYSPTPESPGGALAGSVNLVPRSSFERSRPVFTGSVYMMMRDTDKDFRRSAGGREGKKSDHVFPGFDFNYIRPVNSRFGFTLSAGYSTQYTPQDGMSNTWRGVEAATNGVAFPHTTPDRPYLSSYSVQTAAKDTPRKSFGATIDFKPTPNDRISLSFQYSSFATDFMINTLTFNPTRVAPGDFTPFSTQGAVGAGDVQIVNAPRYRFNETYMPMFVWRHTGPVYKGEAGVGFSRAFDHNNRKRSIGFNNVVVRRTGLTVGFDDIFYLRPRTITVRDGATGQPVDAYDLNSYAIVSASISPRLVGDLQRSAYANVRRDFQTKVPLTLKSGLDVRRSTRDFRSQATAYNFVGADGRATTVPAGGDDQAAAFQDHVFSARIPPYGHPSYGSVSSKALWAHFEKNPQHFVENTNTTYRNGITNSKFAEETIYAGYLRGDLAFLERRLKIVGGLRAEQTNVNAQGPLSDPTRNFRRDASGRPILGANGQPLPIETDALAASKLTFIDRGAHVEKEYLRLFPNVNGSYNLLENLIARAAYYQSVGRPNFNQYAGGLTLPDLEAAPRAANRIQVNNAEIKAWQADTVNVRLEYYFPGVGQISIGAFRRDFENFFGATELEATPEFLALYSLDPAEYGRYRVQTQHNVEGTVRMTGWDINYKQALTFLPHWARGVLFYANGSAQRATGPSLGAFTGSNYVPRSGSWGVSLTREKFNVRTNWNYRGRQRRGQTAAGSSIGPGTYAWGGKRLTIDVQGEYFIRKGVALFANMRNVGNAYFDAEVSGPATPEHAQLSGREDYGALWTFGLKTTF